MPESTRHRRAFELYWRLGAERSIERLHEAMAKAGEAPALRTLYGWSSRYHWQDRVADLEREAREVEDEVRIAEVKAMQERQAKEGLFLQQRGARWLAELTAEDVPPAAAIRAITEGAKLERLARGEVTERIEQRNEEEAEDDQLKELSDAELEALIRRVEALRGEDAQGPE